LTGKPVFETASGLEETFFTQPFPAGGVFLQEDAAWRASFAASFNYWCSMALGLLSLKTR
jgi:hypothetical protein